MSSSGRQLSSPASTSRTSIPSSSSTPTSSASAQLYQLRGRVGRSATGPTRICSKRGRALSEEAQERLKTIGEATELGCGFKFAMRDLEIRGAGNILGEAQRGHIAAVGYDLYCQMVTEAVAEMKGEGTLVQGEIRLDVPDRRQPARSTYAANGAGAARGVPSAGLRSPRRPQVDDIRTEWEDRYGPVPEVAEALLVGGPGCVPSATGSACCDLHDRRGNQARLAPLPLTFSQTTRLRRLARGAIWKEDAQPAGGAAQARASDPCPLPGRLPA